MSIFDIKPLVRTVAFEGHTFHVRVLSGYQLEQWEANRAQYMKDGCFLAQLAIRALCNEHGHDSGKTVEELNALPYTVLQAVFNAAVEHNRLSDEEPDPKAAPGNSGTNSPSPSGGQSDSYRRLSTPGSLQTGSDMTGTVSQSDGNVTTYS